jgi:putative flippase GtrA
VTAEHPTATFAAEGPSGPRLPFLAKYGKFLLVGLTGVVVNLVVFTLTLDAISPSPSFNLITSLVKFASSTASNPVDNLVASAVAFAVATLWNFALNNAWTFRSERGHRHPLAHRLGLYYGVSLGSLAVNEAVLFVAGLYLAPLIGQGIGIVVGSLVGFTGNRRFTFAEAELGP